MASIIVSLSKHDGKPHLAGTNILVSALHGLMEEGLPDVSILNRFAPTIKASDLEAVREFVKTRDPETGERDYTKIKGLNR